MNDIDKLEAGPEMDALIDELLETRSRYFHENLPAYSTDIAPSYTMEERIAELGLIGEYCKHLNDMANARWDAGEIQGRSWQLIHATPEDRCRAALKALDR